MKHESVHPNLFVARNAYLLDQFFLIADGGQCRHEPAIAIISLSDIICGRAFDKELRFVEDIL